MRKSEFTGVHLTLLRKNWRVSRAALAEGIGVNERTVYNWEHDGSSLPVWAAMALAAWTYGLPPLPPEAAERVGHGRK